MPEEVDKYKFTFQSLEDLYIPNMEKHTRLMVWSTKGLNMQRERDAVIDTLAAYVLDMVTVLETKMDNFSPQDFWRQNQCDIYFMV